MTGMRGQHVPEQGVNMLRNLHQSENAVKSQIWIANSVYVLEAIAKKRFMLKHSLYEILQVLSISILEKVPVNQFFTEYQLQYFKDQNDYQLKIFDL